MKPRFQEKLLAGVLSLAMVCNVGLTPVIANAVEGAVSIGRGAVDSGAEQHAIVTGFAPLVQVVQQQAVPAGTALEALSLPNILAATGHAAADSGAETTLTITGVAWELNPAHEVNNGNSTYDPMQGSYAFTPVLPVGYTVAEGVSLPEIWVMVGTVAKPLANETTFDISTGPLTLDSTEGACQGHVITQTGAGSVANTITVTGGTHTVTLNGVSIDVSTQDSTSAFALQNGAAVTLTLVGESTLKSGWNRAGLQAPDGTTLTITGSGKLNAAAGAGYSAGIGSNGTRFDAAIASGTITIAGSANVTAIGGISTSGGAPLSGAGIGGGSNGAGGTITITTSGRVEAIGGGAGGAGIGGGISGAGGTIRITGGNVKATGGNQAAGIGGGSQGVGGSITIGGNAHVTATGGATNDYFQAAGIGSGGLGADAEVLLEGSAIVEATGAGPGIGGGRTDDSNATVTIQGSVQVTATGLNTTNGAGIIANNLTVNGEGALVRATVANPDGLTSSPPYTTIPATAAITRGILLGECTGTNIETAGWKVHGEVTLPGDATIPAGKTLTIPVGAKLIIPVGVTLQNNGTIANSGTIVNNGTITGNPVQEPGAVSITGKSPSEIQSAIQAELDAAGVNSVTVTGSATATDASASDSIIITIPADKAVNWQADYTYAGEAYAALTLLGGGSFEVSAGSIANTGERALDTTGGTVAVTVSGGTVSTGTGVAAIQAGTGTVTVSGTGKVAVTQGELNSFGAIYCSSGVAGRVEISGGEITTASIDLGRYAVESEDSTVVMTGGSISSPAGGSGIWAKEVSVSGSAAISTIDGYGVNASGRISVSGNAAISATGLASALYGTGEDTVITVSGGTLSSTDGSCITNTGENASTTVLGGTLTTGGSPAISGNGSLVLSGGTVSDVMSEEAAGDLISFGTGTITVSGNAKVAASSPRTAIYSEQGNVEVLGGEISSTAGMAIHTLGKSSKVTVSGGMITGDSEAIKMEGLNGPEGGGLAALISGGTIVAKERGVTLLSAGRATMSGGAIIAANAINCVVDADITVTKGILLGTCDYPELSWTVQGKGNSLPIGATIPANQTFTIPAGAELTVPTGVTLQNNGTVEVYGTLNANTAGTGVVTGNINYTWAVARVVNPSGSTAYYASVEEAIEAAAPGGTVTLLQDSTEAEHIDSINKAMTLDLAGKRFTMTGENADGLCLDNPGAHLTIKDSVGGGSLVGINQAVWITSGKLTVESGHLESTERHGVYVNGGAVEIKGGSFQGSMRALNVDKGSVILTGGTFYDLIGGNSIDVHQGTVAKLLAPDYVYYKGTTTGGTVVDGSGDYIDETVTVGRAGGATTYSVTATNGTASPATAAAGDTVTLTAGTPPAGQRFKQWTITPAVSFADGTTAKSAVAKFKMPAQAVSATATYEDRPVGEIPVTGVTLGQRSLLLYSNTTPNTAALTATVAPADATDKTVSWGSGNPAVATVDQSGMVRAVGNGTAVITATTTDGGFTASCTVTVSSYSGGGSGGSGGGSSWKPQTEETANKTVAAAELKDALEAAKTNGKLYARIEFAGSMMLPSQALKELGKTPLYVDTVDGAVQTRIIIPRPDLVQADIRASGAVKGARVENVKAFFEKWFKNKIRIICMEQTGTWGQRVEIAARVDLTGMDAANLYIYRFDQKTNSYILIQRPGKTPRGYWVDKNGYLHFYTEAAGDYIVSEGPLTAK